MKQHAHPQHKPAAQSSEQKGASKAAQQDRKTEERQARGTSERAESDRAERAPMQHGTNQSSKRPMQTPAEDGRAAAQEGQMPQNQQRLGQHQNSRKQP